jgi:uncharacterized protein (TIGR02757 family)
MSRSRLNQKKLKSILDSLYQSRSATHLANDPLSFCHRYQDPLDQEIVGLIASSFAYGNVKIILRNVDAILSRMGTSPRRYVEDFEPREGLRTFAGFKHRFNDAQDLCALLLATRIILDEADSIGEYVLGLHDPHASDLASTLVRFSASVLSFDYQPVFNTTDIPSSSYFSFFFPSPVSGSACKRMCMFFRWMIRPADGIDLGLWPQIEPSKLIIPVDAHIQRIGRFLGLTTRSQADWRMAKEITEGLRLLDPTDPVKYDFSLCHLGISEGCDGKNIKKCLSCPITEICSGSHYHR